MLQVKDGLADFNFDIKYRPGKIHYDADALSRFPIVTEYPLHVSLEVVKASIGEGKVSKSVNSWISSIHGVPGVPAPP